MLVGFRAPGRSDTMIGPTEVGCWIAVGEKFPPGKWPPALFRRRHARVVVVT
jgi:hypothetical protein